MCNKKPINSVLNRYLFGLFPSHLINKTILWNGPCIPIVIHQRWKHCLRHFYPRIILCHWLVNTISTELWNRNQSLQPHWIDKKCTENLTEYLWYCQVYEKKIYNLSAFLFVCMYSNQYIKVCSRLVPGNSNNGVCFMKLVFHNIMFLNKTAVSIKFQKNSIKFNIYLLLFWGNWLPVVLYLPFLYHYFFLIGFEIYQNTV